MTSENQTKIKELQTKINDAYRMAFQYEEVGKDVTADKYFRIAAELQTKKEALIDEENNKK